MRERSNADEPTVTIEAAVPGTNAARNSRATDRVRTVLRVVKVQSSGDEGLARLRNISDGGMMLRLQLPVCLGDTVTVHLEDGRSLVSKVVWTEGQNCGVRFEDAVDCAGLLNEMARSARAGVSRPVRMSADADAVAYTPGGIYPIRVKDISQRGMKVQHRCAFKEGLPVKILLGPGLEWRGVVRWASGDLAGIQLSEPMSLDNLGSSNHLSRHY